MKKTILLLFGLIITNLLSAQNNSIVPIIQQTGEYVQLIEEKYQQKVVHLEFEVLKTSKEIYRQMYADVQYGIIIFGDGNFKNLSLISSFVEDDDWKVVIDEEGQDGIVMLYFTFEKTDFYRFEILADLKAESDYGYYSFLIFR
ncbi:MAG: hypothetical protein JXL97_07265 [Bacteroidales bacterium]|nr:hypothetical protein [Bacteroidales bacterium]